MSPRRHAVGLTQLAIVVGCVVAYEVATRAELLDPFTFVPFTTMVGTLVDQLGSGEYLSETVAPTVLEVLITFAGAFVIGVAGGVLLWWSDTLHYALQPYLLLFYAIPTFALFPVFISLFGSGATAVVATATLGAVPVVLVNTAIGFRETRAVLAKVGRAVCTSRRQIVWHIYFPAARPHIFTGLRLAAAYSIIIVIATEFILSTRGLGHTIAFAYNNFDLKHMYASILLVVALALVTTGALSHVEGRMHARGAS
jgi:NitT/TauT family transport system permease protein